MREADFLSWSCSTGRLCALLWGVWLFQSSPVSAQIVVTTPTPGLTEVTSVAAGEEVQIFHIGVTGSGSVSAVTLTVADVVPVTGIDSTDLAALRLYRSSDATLDGSDTLIGSQTDVQVGLLPPRPTTTVLADVADVLSGEFETFYIVTAVTTAPGGKSFKVGFPEGGVATSAGPVGTGVVELDANRVDIGVDLPYDTVVDYPPQEPVADTHYRVALILFKTSGQYEPTVNAPLELRWPYTPQQLGDVFFVDPDGVNGFIAEVSHGRVSLSGTVAGWYDVGEQDIDGLHVALNYDTFINLAAARLDYSQYDIVYLVGRVPGEGKQAGTLIGRQPIDTPQGKFTVGIDYMVNSDFCKQAGSERYSDCVLLPSAAWPHELLHTLGISGHANSLDCGDVTLGGADCDINAYGNVVSVMGERAYGTHPDIITKEELGWVLPGQIQRVTSTGDYTVYPLAEDGDRVKGLKIPLATDLVLGGGGIEFDHVYVEYRQQLGADRYLQRLEGGTFLQRYTTISSIDSDGVLIYLSYSNPETQSTVLLDMAPSTPYNTERGIKTLGNAGKFADAFLTTGQSFHEPQNDLRITTGSPTGDGGIQVQIEYAPPYAETTQASALVGAATVVAGEEVLIFGIGLTGTGSVTAATVALADVIPITGFDASADIAALRFYRSADATLDDSDILIGTQPEVEVGPISTIGVPTTISSDAPDALTTGAETFYLVSALTTTHADSGHSFNVAFPPRGVSLSNGSVGAAVAETDDDRVQITTALGPSSNPPTAPDQPVGHDEEALPTDYDSSGEVDLPDFFLFSDAFGQPVSEASARFDLNGDGSVNLIDFFLFAESFGAASG